MSAGADVFVDKPLVFKDLFTTLQLLAQLAPEEATAPKRTILVLDDSALALAVTRAALESAGFTVVIAEDLGAFERQRSSCDPDLILVDLQMPEAYGDDIAATLIATKAVDVPVFLFSSVDERELARRTEEAHVSGYIWKGAGMVELIRRCKEIRGDRGVIEDIQRTFMHRFTALARTRVANALDAVTRRDPAAIAVAVRDLHSVAGEAGLLGLAEVVPLARRGEDHAKLLAGAPTEEGSDEMIVLLRELEQVVERP